MTYGSVCSGIEAASVAWEPLGWRPAWFAEIDPFCCAVLKHHYPEVENRGDFTKIKDSPELDLLVGGTPCQSFSVAGKRGGLADCRGNLTLEFLALAQRLHPRWLVWENVPGVMSDDAGRTFGIVLGRLGQLGYGFAYRVLDAQFFGVPQRRRRVFVVGYLGDWRPPAAVLFERACLSRNPEPSRAQRENAPAFASSDIGNYRESESAGHMRSNGGDYGGGSETLIAGTLGGGSRQHGWDSDTDRMTFVADVSPTLNAHFGTKQGLENQRIDGGAGMVVAFGSRDIDIACREDGTTPTIRVGNHQNGRANGGSGLAVATFDERNITSKANRSRVENGTPCHSLHADAPRLAFNLRGRDGGSQPEPTDVASVRSASGGSSRTIVEVRRLTPKECERLQGFPDDFTLVPYRNKPASDSQRYRAIGNSMAAPVMRWIGERIVKVEAVHRAVESRQADDESAQECPPRER